MFAGGINIAVALAPHPVVSAVFDSAMLYNLCCSRVKRSRTFGCRPSHNNARQAYRDVCIALSVGAVSRRDVTVTAKMFKVHFCKLRASMQSSSITHADPGSLTDDMTGHLTPCNVLLL